MSTGDGLRNKWLIATALALITLAAYWQAKDDSFVNYDDADYVINNPRVEKGLTWSGVTWAFKSTHAANWHPVTWLSHMLDCQLYGLDPAGHHLTNVFIHAANVVLLFWAIQLLTGAVWRSAFVAALFALHPLNVQSVAWVSERKNVLSTLFFILAIWAYVGYVRRPGWKRYLLMTVLFALGLMSKPMLVTLPLTLLLLDYWPLNRMGARQSDREALHSHSGEGGTGTEPIQDESSHAGRPVFSLVLEKLPLLALAAASSIVTLIAQKKGGALSSTMPIGVRLGNALVSYVVYLEKTVWPTGLAVFYPLSGAAPPGWRMGLAAMILTGLTALALVAAKRFKYLPVGWFWYIGTLVPVIGIVQVGGQAWADRYAYVPLIGLFVLGVWGLTELTRGSLSRTRLLVVVGVCALIGLTAATQRQLGYWRDSLTLFERAMAVTDRNSIALSLRGAALAELGRVDEAIVDLREAVEADPSNDLAHQNLGMALVEKGRLEEAIDHFRIATEIKPGLYDAYNKLGAALLDEGKLQEATPYFYKVIEINPDYPSAYANLGYAFDRQGRVDDALASYDKALQLISSGAPKAKRAPANIMAAEINFRMGNLLARNGRVGEAVDRYRETLRLEPNFAPAQSALDGVSNGPTRDADAPRR